MQEANNNEALEREQVWMLALISCLEDGKTVQDYLKSIISERFSD